MKALRRLTILRERHLYKWIRTSTNQQMLATCHRCTTLWFGHDDNKVFQLQRAILRKSTQLGEALIEEQTRRIRFLERACFWPIKAYCPAL